MSDCKLNDLYRNPIHHHAPQKLHLVLFIHAILYINMTVKGVEIDFFFGPVYNYNYFKINSQSGWEETIPNVRMQPQRFTVNQQEFVVRNW